MIKSRKWIFALLILLIVTGDYIKRRDFFEEEKGLVYKDYNSLSVLVPEGYSVHGIDVSRHNGELWWEKVAESSIDSNKIEFIFIKCTEGMFFSDKEYLDNWHSAKKYHLIRGAYHFFRPSFSASLQAWNFILSSRLKKGDLPPVLDMEVDEGYSNLVLINKMKIWLQRVEKHYGVKPIIYTNITFYKKVVQGNFDEYPLWIAQYRGEKPNLPIEKTWQFWQYSEKGTLYGINEKVDLNVFRGSSEELKTLLLK